MRSKRSKKWRINRDIREARELIEHGLPVEPKNTAQGRAVPPHRSGGGQLVNVVIDEYGSFHSMPLIKP